MTTFQIPIRSQFFRCCSGFLAIVSVFTLSGVQTSFARTWTDSTGKHTIEADFVSLESGLVTLKKADGDTISIPLDKLTSADREFAKTAAAKADSGNPFTHPTEPPKQAVKGACRVLVTISETGDCTFEVAPLFQQPQESDSANQPEPKVIKHDDGTIEFQHRFTSKEAVDSAIGYMRDNVEFDTMSKLLSLQQRKGDDGKYQAAIFIYPKLIRYPLRLEVDVKNLDQGTLRITLFDISQDKNRNATFHVVSKDKLETAIVRAFSVSGHKPDGRPVWENVLKEQTVKIADSLPIRFRLPVPNAPIDDMFELFIDDVWGVNPILLSGMSVQAVFAPMFGMSLEMQENMIFVKKVFGLAQKAGVQEGDVLVSINGQHPSSREEADELMQKIELGDTCTLVLKRGEKEVTIPIKAE